MSHIILTYLIIKSKNTHTEINALINPIWQKYSNLSFSKCYDIRTLTVFLLFSFMFLPSGSVCLVLGLSTTCWTFVIMWSVQEYFVFIYRFIFLYDILLSSVLILVSWNIRNNRITIYCIWIQVNMLYCILSLRVSFTKIQNIKFIFYSESFS